MTLELTLTILVSWPGGSPKPSKSVEATNDGLVIEGTYDKCLTDDDEAS
jgi:hypothetical protein